MGLLLESLEVESKSKLAIFGEGRAQFVGFVFCSFQDRRGHPIQVML